MSIQNLFSRGKHRSKKTAPRKRLENAASQPLTDENVLMRISGDLLHCLSFESGNSVISPPCLYQMLAARCDVTASETKSQIVEALGGDGERIATVRGISETSAPSYGCEEFDYTTALSLWVSDHLPLNPQLGARKLSTNTEICKFAMGSGGANEAMSKWLSNQTEGMFSEGPKTNSGDLLVGLGAMHLKDSWMHAFEEEEPRGFSLDDERKKRAAFMEDWDDCDLIEGGGTLAFSRHLASGAHIVVSLPPENMTFTEYAGSAAWRNTSSFIRGARTDRYRDCRVYMPKLHISSDGLDMRDAMKSLGIAHVFEPDAGFSPLSPGCLSWRER